MQKMIVRAHAHALGSFVHNEAKLGSDHGFVVFALESAGQNPLTVTCAVIGGGIEKVDAEIECSMDGANRLVIVDVAPAARSIEPVPDTANCPAAQSHGADLQV